MQIHRVKNGESIYDIAKEYEVSPVKIAEDNELEIRGRLPEGRELLILTPSRSYNVKKGDTLGRIATRFRTTKEALFRLNRELGGREKLYPGQLLTIRESTPTQGMTSVNGYLYADTPKERLVSILPHLSYVTVCSAIYKNGSIHSLFSCEEAVALTKSFGRAPIMRIYMTEMPDRDGEKDFACSICLLARGGGFVGAALSSLNSRCRDKKRLESFILTVRKILMESDLILFAEGDLEDNTSYMEYSDAAVLTYDKLHKADIPSFEDGEKRVLLDFAYAGESSRAFVELSGFAFSGGKYIEKRNAIGITDKKRGKIVYDPERKLQIATYGRSRGKQHEIIFESLENTIAKLGLIAELGYMGICFDIGRICSSDLMAAATLFDVVGHPVMNPRVCQEM